MGIRKIIVDDLTYGWSVRECEEYFDLTLKIWRADLGGGQRALIVKSDAVRAITPAEVAGWVRIGLKDGWEPEIGGAPLCYDYPDKALK